MNWAMEQATGDPRAQCLLYVIADCANEQGIAWPGADWMAEKSQQSRATVYRRLELLQETGLLVMFPRWIDENGKIWNAASSGRRRTSPEIRLQFEIMIKHVVAHDEPETEVKPSPPLSQPETGVSQPETTESHQVRRGSSHCSDNNHHLNQEDSPPPPLRGEALAEDWKDFENEWSEPILRQSLAQQVWSSLTPAERALARQAARGYRLHRLAQKRPPTILAAHRFLRERDAWARFAAIAPDVQGPTTGSYDPDSREGRAIIAMHAVAKVRPREARGQIVYRGEITPQILAFADAPDHRTWWIEQSKQIAAWSNFLKDHIKIPRPTLVSTREDHYADRSGIHAPWPWPPSVEGKVYTESTGPPPLAPATEEDLQDFR